MHIVASSTSNLQKPIFWSSYNKKSRNWKWCRLRIQGKANRHPFCIIMDLKRNTTAL